jgi:hypothetical protein
LKAQRHQQGKIRSYDEAKQNPNSNAKLPIRENSSEEEQQ